MLPIEIHAASSGQDVKANGLVFLDGRKYRIDRMEYAELSDHDIVIRLVCVKTGAPSLDPIDPYGLEPLPQRRRRVHLA